MCYATFDHPRGQMGSGVFIRGMKDDFVQSTMKNKTQGWFSIKPLLRLPAPLLLWRNVNHFPGLCHKASSSQIWPCGAKTCDGERQSFWAEAIQVPTCSRLFSGIRIPNFIQFLPPFAARFDQDFGRDTAPFITPQTDVNTWKRTSATNIVAISSQFSYLLTPVCIEIFYYDIFHKPKIKWQEFKELYLLDHFDEFDQISCLYYYYYYFACLGLVFSVWPFWYVLQTALLSCHIWDREDNFKKKSCCTGLKELCSFCHSLTNGNGAPGRRECRSQTSATVMESWGKHARQHREQGGPFFFLSFFLPLWFCYCCVSSSSHKGADIWSSIWPQALETEFDLCSESSSIHVNAPSDRGATTCADRRCCRSHIPSCAWVFTTVFTLPFPLYGL